MILISDIDVNSSQENPELIIVEIKTLKHSQKNSDYYRGLDLATKQITSGRDIIMKSNLNSNSKLRINRGLIILSYVNDKTLTINIDVHHINI
jgi:hypothetical protein